MWLGGSYINVNISMSGGTVNPPVGPGQSPGGVQDTKPPEILRILHFTVPEKRLKTGLKCYHIMVHFYQSVNAKPAMNFKTGKGLQTTLCRLNSHTIELENSVTFIIKT